MRGKESIAVGIGDGIGITPAYAGKNSSSVAMSRAFTDHPRVCGEKCCFGSSCSPSTGSPPRMRGKVSRCCSRRAACGGSPPRMRGKDRLWQQRFHEVGITPAYAGKSDMHANGFCCPKDHPRVCGEKPFGLPSCLNFAGSPPRMRGKDSCGAEFQQPSGITPAYAGKSHVVDTIWPAFWDHPRVCGEKTKKIP